MLSRGTSEWNPFLVRAYVVLPPCDSKFCRCGKFSAKQHVCPPKPHRYGGACSPTAGACLAAGRRRVLPAGRAFLRRTSIGGRHCSVSALGRAAAGVCACLESPRRGVCVARRIRARRDPVSERLRTPALAARRLPLLWPHALSAEPFPDRKSTRLN